jgi:hypothetical protein
MISRVHFCANLLSPPPSLFAEINYVRVETKKRAAQLMEMQTREKPVWRII